MVLGGLSVALVAAGAVLHVLDHAGTAAPITQWWVTNGVSAFGLGLPGARRLMDEFAVISERGRGTTVTMIKWRQA